MPWNRSVARVGQRVALVIGHLKEEAFMPATLITFKRVRVQALGEVWDKLLVTIQYNHQWGVWQ